MRLKRSGFSLVLSLTIMAAMVMMVIVLASFLQVESRLAQSHSGHLRARFNALASARIAIGQLQQLAGPDQRVTMRADMYADNDQTVGGKDATTITPVRTSGDHNINNAPALKKLSHQKRYLTGVWATGGIDSTRVRDWDVTNPTESRLFLGWLASPFGVGPDAETSGAPVNYLANRTFFAADSGNFNRRLANMTTVSEGQKLIDDLAVAISDPADALVPLVSYGSVELPTGLTSFQRNYMGAVDARPQPLPGPAFADGKTLGANGRYAFWIGDEGVKAKVNLPDYYAATANGKFLSNNPWDKGFAGSATQRNSIGTIGGAGDPIKEGVNAKGSLPSGFNFDTWRAKDIADSEDNPQAYQLSKAVGMSGLTAWAAKQGGVAAGDAMNKAVKILWHDVTTYSYSTLTDTYNGGVKMDLSTAFELPYTMFRGVEMYPGQKDSAITSDSKLRKQSWFHGSPNISTNTNGMAVDLDYNRPNLVNTLGSDNDLLLASPRASEWAPRYLKGLLGSSYAALVTRNGAETPERLGFVYEAPLRSALFNQDRQTATLGIGPNAAGTSRTRIAAMPWSEMSVTSTENILGRISRGPTWDLYRNYYRMYKRETEAAGQSSGIALRGQDAVATYDPLKPEKLTVAARGVEPLTQASGNRKAPMQRGRDTKSIPVYATVTPPTGHYAGGAATGNYFYRSNLSAPSDTPSFQGEQRLRYPNLLVNKYSAGQMNFDRLGLANPNTSFNDASFDTPQQLTTRTWPTSMSLTPSIIRFSMVFSGIFDTSTDVNGTIGVSVDPILVVHNPYDTAIEFEGIAMVTNGESLPYIFDVSVSSWAFTSTLWQYYDPTRGLPKSTTCDPKPKTDPLWAGALTVSPITLGEVALGDGENDNRSFSFRAVAGSGKKFHLEPGEVKVLSPKNLGGTYKSTRASNTTIVTDDFGYDLGNTAVYKMTPFANVRYRESGDVTTQWREGSTPDARMRTWGFMPNHPTTGAEFRLTNPTAIGYFGNFCTTITSTYAGLHDALHLWNQVLNSRKLYDAFPSWDGTAKKLQGILQSPPPGNLPNRPLTFTVRNSGWVNYDNCVVGEEGVKGSFNYIYPRKRSGSTQVGGHQSWNFYLIGQKSIDGQQALSPTRRWFGAPDYSNQTDANFKYEGVETAPGTHLVDEPLLLSFHGLTSGWPMYGNDNGHWSNIIQPNEDWKKYMPGSLTVKTPDYRIAARNYATSLKPDVYNAAGSSSSPGNPEYGTTLDPEFGAPEVTGGKAGTLNGRIQGFVSPNAGSLKQQFFMTDFLLRSADMTANTLNKWYPEDKKTPNSLPFKFQTVYDSLGNEVKWGGTYNGISDPVKVVDTLRTPKEMLNAPMSPYFISVRPQQAHLYGYDGKAHSPLGWVLSQRQLISPDGDNKNIVTDTSLEHAYWGASVDPSTDQRADVVLFPIPRRPLLSLAQLGSAGFAQVNTDADFTVGSSFANPGINDLTKVTEWPGSKDTADEDFATPEVGYVAKHEGTRIVRNYANVRTDHAFAANLALWDSYYFSGLNLQANSYSLPGDKRAFPNGPDLPTDSSFASYQKDALKKASGDLPSFDATSFANIKTALEAGYNPLANKRMTFLPDGRPAVADGSFPALTEFPHPTYLSRNALYEGGFNVNSTSKQAWKAVLAGMKGQTLPDGSATTGTVLTKFARSFKPSDGSVGPWNTYRELTDAEIDDLASQVVREVRDRGPFMSLGDFINRRLLAADHGLKGALQAAIDASKINDKAIVDAAAGGPNALSGGVFEHPPASDWTDYNSRNDIVNFKDTNGVWSFIKNGPAYARSSPRFPRLASMSRNGKYTKQVMGTQPNVTDATAGLGAPQIVTQMDVLNSVGPNLTPRSDTFTVRAYGEALDNAGNTIGRAWVEVVVQRTPYFMSPSAKGPAYDESTRRKLAYRGGPTTTATTNDNVPVLDPYESVVDGTNALGLPSGSSPTDKDSWIINRHLGRRFKTTSIRWLNANEI
jgi:hypothetical protein